MKIKDGDFSGIGYLHSPMGGEEYIGTFKSGVLSGPGIRIGKNGGLYSGYWKQGMEHGFGRLSSEVCEYIGYFKHG